MLKISTDTSSLSKNSAAAIAPAISVIGLGKLGAPLVGVMASQGFNTVGVDISHTAVQAINNLQPPVSEPGLENLLARTEGRLRATTDFTDAILNTTVTFIIVPTPSDASAKFSNAYVLDAVVKVAKAISQKPDQEYHLVNITSTVIPGSCETEIKDTLEKYSGRKLGNTLGLTYNPEFIALGTVVRDLLSPDMILIGESDAKAGAVLELMYTKLCINNPPICKLSLINAELAKITLNAYLTTKISFANSLSELAETYSGADAKKIITAISLDSRVSPKFLNPGLGFGGPCLPRDSRCYAALAQERGCSNDLAIATTVVNEHQITRLINLIQQNANPSDKIAILGIAYKAASAVCDDSTGMHLVATLHNEGFNKVATYDPQYRAGNSNLTHCQQFSTMQAAVANAQVIVVATAEQEFLDLSNMLNPNMTVIDPWRIFKENSLGNAKHIYLGRNTDSDRPKENTVFTWMFAKAQANRNTILAIGAATACGVILKHNMS